MEPPIMWSKTKGLILLISCILCTQNHTHLSIMYVNTIKHTLIVSQRHSYIHTLQYIHTYARYALIKLCIYMLHEFIYGK